MDHKKKLVIEYESNSDDSSELEIPHIKKRKLNDGSNRKELYNPKEDKHRKSNTSTSKQDKKEKLLTLPKKGEKIVSFKPTNHPIDGNDTECNDDNCFICGDGGTIICCDNCYRSYHPKCLKIDKKNIGDEWVCLLCEKLQKNLTCANCEKPTKDEKAYMKLSCSQCLRGIHYGCADVPLLYLLDAPLNKYYVLESQKIREIRQKVIDDQKIDNDPEEILKQLYNEFNYETLYYACNNCIEMLNIQKIKNYIKTKDFPSKLFKSPKESSEFFFVKLKSNNTILYYMIIKAFKAYILLRNELYTLHCLYIGCSDVHQFWISHSILAKANNLLLKKFIKSEDLDDSKGPDNIDLNNEDEDTLSDENESFKIEKILALKRPLKFFKKTYNTITDDLLNKNLREPNPYNHYQFLVKWEDLDYSDISWEDQFIIFKFKDKLKKFLESKTKKKGRNKKSLSKLDNNNNLPRKFDKQPECIEGPLYDYQIEGVNWLVNSLIQKNNAILADEMGLGKTIQTLCFLKYLTHEFEIDGPFLIITPASTLYNWAREASKWTPNLDYIIYGGNTNSRDAILEYEFLKNKTQTEKLIPRFNIAITSYTYILQDIKVLKKINWEVVIVDEAQRLKNEQSKFFQKCGELKTNFKLLLTGTPIQNNLDELLTLVKYIIPNQPKLLDELDNLNAILTKSSGTTGNKKFESTDYEREMALKKLKQLLKNHMLRRTVQEAKLKFPELEEKIVKLSLTKIQKQLYKNILLKNYKVLSNLELMLGKQMVAKNKKISENLRVPLANVLMSLRLVCDHPNLFYSKSKNLLAPTKDYEEEMLNSSNKLKFLDKIIPHLLKCNHKILIFTQFVLMLDIIEEYLIHKDYEYERLDGTTKNIDRQKIIDNFNFKKSKIFILSTRAGGLGINLTSSDTVIFLDSDFNPYRDIQAFCRAYRIGQKNNVLVYRLVSKFTVEEKIVENAAKKLMLGEIIINPLESGEKDQSAIDSILKHGAKELFDKTFDQEEEDKDDITEEKLEELLKRESKLANSNSNNDEHTNIYKKNHDLNDFYLSGFNFIDFNFTPIMKRNNPNNTEDHIETKYWETVLGGDSLSHNNIEEEEYGKGKRLKKQSHQGNHLHTNQETNSESVEFQIRLEPEGVSDQDSDSGSEFRISRRDKNAANVSSSDENLSDNDKKNPVMPELLQQTLDTISKTLDTVKEMDNQELENNADKLLFLNKAQRLLFLNFVLKSGLSPGKIEYFFSIFIRAGEKLRNFVQMPDIIAFRNYAKMFYSVLLFFDQVKDKTSYFFFKFDPYCVLKRITGLCLLKNKINSYSRRPEKFKIKSKSYTEILKKSTHWKNIDDFALLKGLMIHGFDEWDQILSDKGLWETDGVKGSVDPENWKNIYAKIDGKSSLQQENEDQEYLKYTMEYIKVRSNLLLDFLIEEDQKRKD